MRRSSLLWFRRDLRLADHPALAAAAADGDVTPLFVLDPALVRPSGPNRLRFLLESLEALRTSTGGALVVRHGDPAVVVPEVAAGVAASAVFVTADFGPYGARRDRHVRDTLSRDQRHLVEVGSPYAVDPGTIRKDDGRSYAVFTPFSRAWLRHGWPESTPVSAVRWSRPQPSDPWSFPAEVSVELPRPGEAAAHTRMDAFFDGPIDDYGRRRDLPAERGTSGLSADLRWGALHPRQLLDRLEARAAHDAFRNELCWREFYADVLHHHPASARRNLQPAMDRLPVDRGAAARVRFGHWARGHTGYPMVDAGMRQLLATGWMHNRVRMVTASFLVKDLHLPWQWGARHFMRHLVDGDLASNSHGWQWTAGTGTDAAPFFRIFNPVTQGQRHDPEGAYVRRWLPELGAVPDRHVHAPWLSPRGVPLGYPPPMVDHREEREEALRRYALVTRRG